MTTEQDLANEVMEKALLAAIDGEIPRPPQESWQPYTIEVVVEQYIQISLGNQKCQ